MTDTISTSCGCSPKDDACPEHWAQNELASSVADTVTEADEVSLAKTIDTAKLEIIRHRYSVTQGEVTLRYDGQELGRWGDSIEMHKNSTKGTELIAGWSGLGDAYWQQVAARKLTEKAKPESISATEAARLIRADLKAAFPRVKFSVRSKSFSMGSEVCVDYTDGPASSEVQALMDCYGGRGFDSRDDSTFYHKGAGQYKTGTFLMVQRHRSEVPV